MQRPGTAPWIALEAEAMTDTAARIVPPAPPVHVKDLSPVAIVAGMLRNNLSVWPERAFELDFSRSRLFGIETVLVNDPEGCGM